ncbi:MAG: C13 family peptidase [Promethearchaeota archaeon]
MKKSIYGILLAILVTFSLFSLTVNIEINYTTKTTNKTLKTEATLANIGAWIIVGGDRSDHDKLEQIKWGCNKTYEILKECGYTDDQIYYLFPDTDWATECPYADTYTTRANIQTAIETWADNYVDSSHALGMYLFDHGGDGVMCVPGVDLTDTNLNTYLDNLEASSGCNRMFIIYAACEAGSFINPLSKDNRIIVTSTSATLGSGSNPDKTWERFSETFWASIKTCRTIGEAFEDAEANIHALGYGNSQKPWIDDNHDETGHETDAAGNLPNGGDGNDALNIKICKKVICWLIPLIVIIKIPIKWWINPYVKLVSMWAQIQNMTAESIPEHVYARVIPPQWSPPPLENDSESSFLDNDDGVGLAELFDRDGDGNYTGSFYPSDFPEFPDGLYKVNIYAKSASGDVAPIESTGFWVNAAGVPPPDNTDPDVAVITPLENADVSGIVQVSAEGDDDQALDRIDLYIDGVKVNTTQMPDYYPYPAVTYEWDTSKPIPGATSENSSHNITAEAYDKSGNSAIHTIFVNTEVIPGFTFTMLFIGCILVVIVAYFFNPKRKNVSIL